MKKITLLFMVVLTMQLSYTQVTLDAEYNGEVTIVKFAKAGEKIVFVDEDNSARATGDTTPRDNTIVTIYNLDNSLYKTIDIGNEDSVQDVSQHIVNKDDKLELMISHYEYNSTTDTDERSFYIINEDLTEIFKLDGWDIGEPGFESRDHEDKFLFQTEDGIKLFLEKWEDSSDDKHRIYSLGGNATLSNKRVSAVIDEEKAFPNPSSKTINIPYTSLNNEIVEITMYDINGKIIEQKKMDGKFDTLSLNISGYAQGTYLYTVKNSLGVYKSKFVKK